MVGIRNFHLDDYMMLVALVVYSLETACAYSVGAIYFGVANNGMTDEERASLDPDSHEYYLRVGGSKVQLIGWSLYTLLLWTLKLCMNTFYSRLTDGLDNVDVRVNIGYVFIGVTYVATVLSIHLGCRPYHKNWQINPDPGNYCQPAISKIDCYVTLFLNVFTDLYLMSIPLPILWKSQMPRRKKYLLLVMFSGGIFVTMAGCLRCALILTNPVTGAEKAGSWACRETFVAVVIGNVPMIYPMFRRWMTRLGATSVFSSYLSASRGHKLSGDSPSTLVGQNESSKNNSSRQKKKKFRHPLSIPMTGMTGLTRTGSEEMIVVESTMTGETIEEEGRKSSQKDGSSSSRKESDSIKDGIHVSKEAQVSVRKRSDTPPSDEMYHNYPYTHATGPGYNVHIGQNNT
ncbi:MAG: hypothetical protein M1834_001615 [Cirrosporium novae-zelandiae]|nr:MAG: hypothetical protein M1834_004132 [Cirrosporium novae-zelandiae]KAI9735599.1 MAG: hypothetical protein M1834_001615 [Cirrosporium novae-zelandiae]